MQSRITTLAARAALTILAALGALTALPALAHHSNSAYQVDEIITLTGTVKEWRWSNPHTWLLITVEGEDGTEPWEVVHTYRKASYPDDELREFACAEGLRDSPE